MCSDRTDQMAELLVVTCHLLRLCAIKASAVFMQYAEMLQVYRLF